MYWMLIHYTRINMIISKTPLRCSFFGGGTDFKEYYGNTKRGYGNVLSTALDKYVYITVKKNFDDTIRIVHYENELAKTVDEVKHNIIREAMKLTGIESGIEIIYMADIPLSLAGVGLASSSALAVGVLNALYAYKGIYVPAFELAKQACKIEIEILGQQIGTQDQYAVAFGGFNRYLFYGNSKVKVIPVICKKEYLSKFQENLMLYYTGLTRDSGAILMEQSSSIITQIPLLDDIAEMVNMAYENLVNGNTDYIGYLLDLAWENKKKLASGITNGQIDKMYKRARLAGAYGGKILGAGGGGFLLLYVPKEYQKKVEEELKDYQKVEFSFEQQGSNIIFVD